MSQHPVKAVLFDLGETLLNFGRVNTGALFQEAGRDSYRFLVEAGQPVEKLRTYLWQSLFRLRMRYFLGNIIGRDFDSLALLKKYGTKKGINLTEQQWQQFNWLWYEPLAKKASIESAAAHLKYSAFPFWSFWRSPRSSPIFLSRQSSRDRSLRWSRN